MILIDANSVGFAATAANDLRSGNVQTGGVFGFLRTLRGVRETYGGTMFVLWDGKSWRYDEFSDYKGNRKTNPKLIEVKERWKPQRRLVAQALQTMGVRQMFSINMEADDLAARVVAKQKGKDMVLVSGDKDWTQLVSDTVRWVDPVRSRTATLDNFKEITECDTPWQLVQTKALTGDPSDNIPGVGGLGDKAAEFIFTQFGDVQNMINEAHLDRKAFDSLPKKYRDFVDSEDKIAAYRRNLRLVWLNHPGLPTTKDLKLTKGAFDRERFCDLCGELAFVSILRDADAWLAPFRTLDFDKVAT